MNIYIVDGTHYFFSRDSAIKYCNVQFGNICQDIEVDDKDKRQDETDDYYCLHVTDNKGDVIKSEVVTIKTVDVPDKLFFIDVVNKINRLTEKCLKQFVNMSDTNNIVINTDKKIPKVKPKIKKKAAVKRKKVPQKKKKKKILSKISSKNICEPELKCDSDSDSDSKNKLETSKEEHQPLNIESESGSEIDDSDFEEYNPKPQLTKTMTKFLSNCLLHKGIKTKKGKLRKITHNDCVFFQDEDSNIIYRFNEIDNELEQIGRYDPLTKTNKIHSDYN